MDAQLNELRKKQEQWSMSDTQYPERFSQLTPYRSPTAILESRLPPLEGFAPPLYGSTTPLSHYWYVLLNRRWMILSAAAVLGAIVAVWSFRMTPVYEGTARLEIEPEASLMLSQSSSNVFQKVDADDIFLQTQIQVLRSDTLAWQTIEQLNLAGHLEAPAAKGAAALDPGRRKAQLISAFVSHLKVEQVPKTRLLSVSFLDSDPQLAAQVA
jgi:uncharacterized protein involved in exopolysaccharide biosynthesis